MSLFLSARYYDDRPLTPTSYDEVAIPTMSASQLKSKMTQAKKTYCFYQGCVKELESIQGTEYAAAQMLQISDEDRRIRREYKDYRIQRVVRESARPFLAEGNRLLAECQRRRKSLAEKLAAKRGNTVHDLTITDLVIAKMESLEKCHALQGQLNQHISNIKDNLDAALDKKAQVERRYQAQVGRPEALKKALSVLDAQISQFRIALSFVANTRPV